MNRLNRNSTQRRRPARSGTSTRLRSTGRTASCAARASRPRIPRRPGLHADRSDVVQRTAVEHRLPQVGSSEAGAREITAVETASRRSQPDRSAPCSVEGRHHQPAQGGAGVPSARVPAIQRLAEGGRRSDSSWPHAPASVAKGRRGQGHGPGWLCQRGVRIHQHSRARSAPVQVGAAQVGTAGWPPGGWHPSGWPGEHRAPQLRPAQQGTHGAGTVNCSRPGAPCPGWHHPVAPGRRARPLRHSPRLALLRSARWKSACVSRVLSANTVPGIRQALKRALSSWHCVKVRAFSRADRNRPATDRSRRTCTAPAAPAEVQPRAHARGTTGCRHAARASRLRLNCVSSRSVRDSRARMKRVPEVAARQDRAEKSASSNTAPASCALPRFAPTNEASLASAPVNTACASTAPEHRGLESRAGQVGMFEPGPVRSRPTQVETRQIGPVRSRCPASCAMRRSKQPLHLGTTTPPPRPTSRRTGGWW